MRFQTFAVLGLAAATLAGCVAPMPPATTVTTAPSVITTPTVLDAASRQVARTVINAEMEKRLPGANVAPYTDCVVNNATTAELIDIAQASSAGSDRLAAIRAAAIALASARSRATSPRSGKRGSASIRV